MRNLIKNKKKKGFTLIEMVAVVAIIGILAAILVPKIAGYMDEAKKTAVINQARQVVQAAEAAQLKGASATDFTNKKVAEITNATYVEFLNGADISKLGDAITYDMCKQIVNDNKDFEVTSGGVFDKLKP